MRLLTRQEVLEALYDKWNYRTGSEKIYIDEAIGRIADEDIFAEYPIPMVRASRMDGVAVKSEMFKDGMPDTSGWIEGEDYVRADTGDDFDDAFDAVIAIEQVKILENGGIKISESVKVKEGLNIAPSGSTLPKGALMLKKGTRIRAEDIACIAMSGSANVRVRKKPIVAFIPTGSELVKAGSELKRGQNFDSNSHMIRAMLRDMGAKPLIYSIVKDDREMLKTALLDALSKADAVILGGGSSKGGEDFSVHILEEDGDIVSSGVASVPGRPMTIALMAGKPVVNISGPAPAAYNCIDWSVRAMICSMLGIPYSLRHKVRAVLAEDISTPPMMEAMVKMHVFRTEKGFMARPCMRWEAGMRDLIASNGLIISARGVSDYPAGSSVDVDLTVNPEEIPWE